MRGKLFVAAIASLSFIALPVAANAATTAQVRHAHHTEWVHHAGRMQHVTGANRAARTREVGARRGRPTGIAARLQRALRHGTGRFATVSATTSGVRHGPGTPTLSANPSTGLLDGQQITVTGSGFDNGAVIAIVECAPGAVDESACDLSFADQAKANKAGAFTTPDDVFRFINVNGTIIDCAQSDGCLLGAADINNVADAAATAISFQDVTVVPPTVSVDPSTGLLDGQQVTVSGADFSPDTAVNVVECQTSGAADQSGCDFNTAIFLPVDATGSFSTSYDVTRLIQGSSGTVDCAGAGACVLEAINVNGTEVATTPIAFAPVRIKKPTLQVTPSSRLVDGQSVTVTGKNYRPGEPLVVSECPAKTNNAQSCGLGDDILVTASPTGHIKATFDAARQLDLGLAEADCAHAACALTAADAEGFGNVLASSNRMRFNPNVPTLPPLTLTVKLGGTATLTAGQVELTGKVSCSSTSPVEVDYQASLTQGLKGNVVGEAEGAFDCTSTRSAFTIDVLSLGKPFTAGSATAELVTQARTGSSVAQDDLSVPVTLTAGGAAAPDAGSTVGAAPRAQDSGGRAGP